MSNSSVTCCSTPEHVVVYFDCSEPIRTFKFQFDALYLVRQLSAANPRSEQGNNTVGMYAAVLLGSR